MIEFYKEKLMFYRLLLTFGVAALSGCIAWIFAQYEHSSIMQILANLSAMLCLSVVCIKTIRSIQLYHEKMRRTK